MLTPMITQYLIGLCCYHRNPEAVDVIIGDMVYDAYAEEKRDVDVTVTLKDGETLKAFEVKREARPLDVATVEQLTIKLRDMPSVTDRAIVSTSGFSASAIKKAESYGVQLYEMKPWTLPMSVQFESFKDSGSPEEFFAAFYTSLLCWTNYKFDVVVPDGPQSFSIELDKPVLRKNGNPHEIFKDWNSYADAVLLRSTDVLFRMQPASMVQRTFPFESVNGSVPVLATPAWPHTHTVDVREDKAFLKFGESIAQIAMVTINGYLRWQKQKRVPEFYIIEDVATKKPLAGTVIAEAGPGGRLISVTVSPETREIRCKVIQLADKHKNAIRDLSLKLDA